MSSAFGPTIWGKTRVEHGDDFGRVVDRERGLGEEREVVLGAERQLRDILGRFDQRDHSLGHLAHRADHLWMTRMADEQDVLALFDLAFGLAVNLAHQRTCCVDIEQLAALRLGRDCLGNAVRAEHHRRIVGHLVELLDEDRALGLQPLDHEAVVDDFMAHIHWGAVLLERALDYLDRPVHACTEASRGGDQDLEHRVGAAFRGRILKGRVHSLCPSASRCAKLGRAFAARLPRTAFPMFHRLFRPVVLLPLAGALALSGCAKKGEIVVGQGGAGITALRSKCPAVGVPDYTGDITLFRQGGGQLASDLDVTASLTNVRSTCNDTGEKVYSEASFDVFARRADARGARQVSLPYFVTVLRGGSAVVSKQVGMVTIDFADGQERAKGSAKAGAYVLAGEATLPRRHSSADHARAQGRRS